MEGTHTYLKTKKKSRVKVINHPALLTLSLLLSLPLFLAPLL